MGATANDSTIGVGFFLFAVLLLHMWIFGQRCVFLVFIVFSVCFLGVGVFFLLYVVGDGGLISVFLLCEVDC